MATRIPTPSQPTAMARVVDQLHGAYGVAGDMAALLRAMSTSEDVPRHWQARARAALAAWYAAPQPTVSDVLEASLEASS